MIDGYRDGPSITLIDWIVHANYKPPSDWKGCRVLTDKWL